MYVISSTSTLKPTNVSWILGLLSKARWMWPVEVTIVVFVVVVIVKLWCLQDAEFENQSRCFWPIRIQVFILSELKFFFL